MIVGGRLRRSATAAPDPEHGSGAHAVVDPPPRVPDAGRAALLLMGSRVAGLYLAGISVAVLLTPPHGHVGTWAAALVVVALSGAVTTAAVARRPCLRCALVFSVSVAVGMAALAWPHPSLTPHEAQLLLGSFASASAAGVALSWGPGAGLAATSGVLACWAVESVVLGVPVEGSLFGGALTGGLLGTTASYLLRRGYTVTQRALVAAEEAVTARAVAAARWQARRTEIRTLHDTVLSTLSLLAQGAHGVDAAALRADCRLQAARLRESDLRAGQASAAAPDPAPAVDGAAVLGPFEVIRRRWAARSLEVGVYGSGDALLLRGLTPSAASALLGAVEECLENVRRHAGVGVASVVLLRSDAELRCLVTDEGRGFDGWDTATQRIGLGDSVVGRIREAGGVARVWSAPGSGTSVALSLPVTETAGSARSVGP
jgi:hypothetical protein